MTDPGVPADAATPLRLSKGAWRAGPRGSPPPPAAGGEGVKNVRRVAARRVFYGSVYASFHPFIMRKAALTCVVECSDTCVAYVGQSEYRLIQHVLTTVEVEI